MASPRLACCLRLAASAVVILWAVASLAQESPCKFEVVAQATSPDGHFTAALTIASCGGHSVKGMFFMVHKNGSNQSMGAFEVTGQAEGEIRWEGSAKVVVLLPVGSDISWHGTLDDYPEVYVATLHPK